MIKSAGRRKRRLFFRSLPHAQLSADVLLEAGFPAVSMNETVEVFGRSVLSPRAILKAPSF